MQIVTFNLRNKEKLAVATSFKFFKTIPQKRGLPYVSRVTSITKVSEIAAMQVIDMV